MSRVSPWPIVQVAVNSVVLGKKKVHNWSVKAPIKSTSQYCIVQISAVAVRRWDQGLRLVLAYPSPQELEVGCYFQDGDKAIEHIPQIFMRLGG